MSQKETIERVYGSIPKEITPGYVEFNWILEYRTVKYYYLKLVRFFTR